MVMRWEWLLKWGSVRAKPYSSGNMCVPYHAGPVPPYKPGKGGLEGMAPVRT